MRTLRTVLAAAAMALQLGLASATPTFFSGTLTSNDPTYHRTVASLDGSPPVGLSPVASAVHHDTYAFQVTATETYVVQTLSALFDSFIAVYEGLFDPSQPMDHVLLADDDGGVGALSSITSTFSVGQTYVLVVTSFSDGELGNYSGQLASLTGAGEVVLTTDAPGRLPESPAIALVGLALACLAYRRRRTAAGSAQG